MSSRSELLASSCREKGIDAFLTTDIHDLRWLTGFTGSSGLALCGESLRVFVTDFRYAEQAQAEVDGSYERLICRHQLHDVLAGAIGDGVRIIGVDASGVSVSQFETLRDALAGTASLEPVDGVVAELRQVKDQYEIDAIEAATGLADEAFIEVVGRGLIGRRERDVAWALEQAVRERGAEGMSFEPIVAAGPRAALPHATPSDALIGKDTLVVIDWGARLDGYCSDCTRTLATGSIGDAATAAYAAVLDAQRTGCGAIGPDVLAAEADGLVRARLREEGLEDFFGHGLGHGVGLEVHEGPRLSKTSNDRLKPGMVVTVEPGVYMPGEYGIRIEDLLVITEDGTRSLTSIGRDLLPVG